MKKIIKKIRTTIAKVKLDTKDHILLSVIYLFIVVQPAMWVSNSWGMISIYIGFATAVLWELGSAEFKWSNIRLKDSIKDLLCYVFVMLPIYLNLAEYFGVR